MRTIVLAAVLGAATPVLAAERSFEVSAVIPAAPAEVFKAFTTPKGWKRFGVPFAAVDFRVGGIVETNYRSDAHIGQPDNIKNQVVAYVPGRLVVLKNVQAPPSFPYPKEFATTVTVFELRPEGANATRVTVSGVGYGEGPAYDWLLEKFKEGDAWSLKALANSYARKPPASGANAPPFTKSAP